MFLAVTFVSYFENNNFTGTTVLEMQKCITDSQFKKYERRFLPKVDLIAFFLN